MLLWYWLSEMIGNDVSLMSKTRYVPRELVVFLSKTQIFPDSQFYFYIPHKRVGVVAAIAIFLSVPRLPSNCSLDLLLLPRKPIKIERELLSLQLPSSGE